MDKIDLINKEESPEKSPEKLPEKQNSSQLEESTHRLSAKRPQKLSVSKVISENEKWRQCKIIGKNISIRSYSAACTYNKKLYIYGGYQILKGNMGDFYCIDLRDQIQKFNWEPIEAKGDLPGPRSKHALIGAKSRIFLVGGLHTDVRSSDKIYRFSPEDCTWTLIKPEGEQLPEIDSFGCVYLEKDGEERIIIFGGWDGAKAEYLNSVYEYNITKNKISILFEGRQQPQQGTPNPRSGCAATTDGKNVFIFGGKDSENRLNDLWEFNMTNYKFIQLEKKGDIPPERNGHTMEYFEGKLYVFGGIHDITWELDDLHIYNLEKKKWTTLEQDSPRKIEKKREDNESISKEKGEKKSPPKKKNWYDTVNTLYGNNNKSTVRENSPTRKNLTSYRDEENGGQSPGKMIDEQRKKAFMHKKNQMLKNFEVSGQDKNRYIAFETQSQAIKNSLDVIGNPNPKAKIPEGRLTDFGRQSQSKFMQPLSNNSNLIIGKKPCARDGHCSVIIDDQLIIFAGDRHQMSFSDIHKLNFGIARREVSKEVNH